MGEMKIDVLDHGYVEFIESWGSDERIIEAARMSTNKGFKGWGKAECPKCGWTYEGVDAHAKSTCEGCGFVGVNFTDGDERLLGYLYRNKHSTPFEMAGLVIEVKAPIFVFRQWHRHRTQSYNEMSARYTPLPAEDYVPSVERLMVNSTKNKQAGKAKGASDLTEESAAIARESMVNNYKAAELAYKAHLKAGVPKELARLVLPVARYSRMRASANLRNWLAFLTLRMDSHAQYEVRVYADAVGEFIKEKFPRTWKLFVEGINE